MLSGEHMMMMLLLCFSSGVIFCSDPSRCTKDEDEPKLQPVLLVPHLHSRNILTKHFSCVDNCFIDIMSIAYDNNCLT